jgi:hypothetical protein
MANKKITARGIFVILFIVMAILQLTGAALFFFRFNILKVQNIVIGVIFIVIAFALNKNNNIKKQ